VVVQNAVSPKTVTFVVDAMIAIVLALQVLLYVFLIFGDIGSAVIAFIIAIAISLGARLVVVGLRKEQSKKVE
jgi:hypothetical protein